MRSVCGNAYDAYLLCAIGLRYMIFHWDPRHTGPTAQRRALWLQLTNGMHHTFATELRPVPSFDAHVTGNLAIDFTQALSLDPTYPTVGNVTMQKYLNHVRQSHPNNPHPAG